MSLFKKKKKEPAVFYSLRKKIEETRAKGETVFYYALEDKEVEKVRAWALRNYHIIVEPDHKNDNVIVYKFYNC